MTKKEFEKLVAEGIAAVPEKFARLLENVAIVIETEPSERQRREMALHEDETLFGLYEGIPHADRGSDYSGVLPDKITIFMSPILEEARDETGVCEIVRDTVWHEIAHHFGFNEKEIEAAEGKRAGRKGAAFH